jgi:hypothetical protein
LKVQSKQKGRRTREATDSIRKSGKLLLLRPKLQLCVVSTTEKCTLLGDAQICKSDRKKCTSLKVVANCPLPLSHASSLIYAAFNAMTFSTNSKYGRVEK